ncbi:GNAT family N-acetyltransferase [Catenovulum sp. SM1970]|nr:GNAT family N-acetyltransferase [Marinifaba aquimaris]
MQIRTAKKDDLAQILQLYDELRPNDPLLTPEQAQTTWQNMLHDDRTDIIVADMDGKLASTCSLTLNLTLTNGAKPFAMIEHVVTSADFRRQGLSQKVIDSAIKLAWQKGCYKVMLLSGEQLKGAHQLYRSVGLKDGIERGFVIKPD